MENNEFKINLNVNIKGLEGINIRNILSSLNDIKEDFESENNNKTSSEKSKEKKK